MLNGYPCFHSFDERYSEITYIANCFALSTTYETQQEIHGTREMKWL